MKRFIYIIIGVLACQFAFAQSKSARVAMNGSNTDFPLSGGGLIFLDLHWINSPTGGAITGNFDSTFSGLNQDGEEAVMSLSGQASASATYGTVRTSAGGTLSGAFYNADNTPFVNSQTGDTDLNGVPDIMNVQAQAGWTDRLAAGGTATNYLSTWIFDITGSNSGDSAFSYLQVRVGNNETQSLYLGDSTINRRVRFSGFAIGNGEEELSVNVFTTFQPQTQFIPQGGSLSGQSDFGNTVKFAGVELRDLNGNIVNTTITSASGYTYNVVPEPASMIALGAGLAALIRRKKSR
jgi:hypothetical protein